MVVLLVGTNNVAHTPSQTAGNIVEGIESIVWYINGINPNIKVLVLVSDRNLTWKLGLYIYVLYIYTLYVKHFIHYAHTLCTLYTLYNVHNVHIMYILLPNKVGFLCSTAGYILLIYPIQCYNSYIAPSLLYIAPSYLNCEINSL